MPPTGSLGFRFLFVVVKYRLEALVNDDLCRALLWLSKAGVSAQTSKTGVTHRQQGERPKLCEESALLT